MRNKRRACLESPDDGVSTRGDVEPLIDETTFYRVQVLFSMAAPSWPVRDRGIIRIFRSGDSCVCATCSRPLTGSWSKGRNGHYAYW